MPDVDHTILIELTAEMCEEADEAGDQRQRRAMEVDAQNANNLQADIEESFRMHRHGCRGERACKCYLDPIEWHKYHLKLGQPDLGENIDVKTPRGPFGQRRRLIAIPNTVHRLWKYPLVNCEGERLFRLMGWAWGFELIACVPRALQPGRPCHVMEWTVPPLRPMSALLSIEHPFTHDCEVCDAPNVNHGFGVSLNRGLPGHWFCGAHKKFGEKYGLPSEWNTGPAG